MPTEPSSHRLCCRNWITIEAKLDIAHFWIFLRQFCLRHAVVCLSCCLRSAVCSFDRSSDGLINSFLLHCCCCSFFNSPFLFPFSMAIFLLATLFRLNAWFSAHFSLRHFLCKFSTSFLFFLRVRIFFSPAIASTIFRQFYRLGFPICGWRRNTSTRILSIPWLLLL